MVPLSSRPPFLLGSPFIQVVLDLLDSPGSCYGIFLIPFLDLASVALVPLVILVPTMGEHEVVEIAFFSLILEGYHFSTLDQAPLLVNVANLDLFLV